MSFAEVAVAVPSPATASTFFYAVPPDLPVAPGQLVLVPFGPRRSHGIVLRLLDQVDLDEVRSIDDVLEAEPVLTPAQLQLARWLSERYLAPLGKALELMIPAGLRASFDQQLSLRSASPARALKVREQRLLDYLRESGPTRLRLVRSRLGMADASRVVQRLARDGLIVREPVVLAPRPRPARATLVELTAEGKQALAGTTVAVRAPRQAEALAFLSAQPEGRVALDHLRAETGAERATVQALVRHGWARIGPGEPPRTAATNGHHSAGTAPSPTPAQRKALGALVAALEGGVGAAFLLHGVTASGKTEVYLRLIEAALARGKGAIALVPEIALTPQMLHRFGSRFPGEVVVMHSRLTPAERFEAWRRVRERRARVVVGSRSALFAPMPNLGVVVVDEEHEPAYKHDAAPRYHARAAALELGRAAKAVVVLGSATPDVQTYEGAWRGELKLVEMPERVVGPRRGGRIALPRVEVVDMRPTVSAGGSPLFSPRLVDLLGETLGRREQAILFLNRRGAATLVICANCGYVPRCRRCDVALVYHTTGEELVCHQCNRRERPRDTCRECGSTRLQYLGAGTQRVAAELARLFPSTRVIRWDRDAMRRRATAEQLLGAFSRGEADVLVGTQAIAKGLDLPGVTLVGIVSADTLLHLPDPRAAERTFQLLTQVAGRAGRGDREGRVVLQAFSPEHACIRAAARYDYAAFAKAELRFRREHGYPPYAELARAVYASSGEAAARAAAARQAAALRALNTRMGLADTDVIGPAPCYYRRIRGRHRWQVLVRGREAHRLLRAAAWPPGWVVDVDPVSML